MTASCIRLRLWNSRADLAQEDTFGSIGEAGHPRGIVEVLPGQESREDAMRRMSIIAAVLFAAVLAPSGAQASRYDYAWALPEWRATFTAPRLADNRGFAVRSTSDAVYVAGVTGSYGRGAGDLFLLRYSPSGALQWSRAGPPLRSPASRTIRVTM